MLNVRFLMLSARNMAEEVNTKDSSLNTPLHLAIDGCHQDYIEILETLTDLGADLEVVNGSGETPLSMAMGRGNQEAMVFLFSRGANQIRECSPSPQH